MIITDIKSGRDSKLHVYVDGEYMLTVTDEICFRHGIKKGGEISETELDELRGRYMLARAKDKALSLLTTRDHSEYELRQKLQRQFDEESVEYAVSELRRLSLLDDERFASRYASELQRNKGYSHRRIEQELTARGISRDIVSEVLEELPEDAQQQIYDIIERKYARSMSDEKGVRRAVAGLARLGYSYGDIYSVIKQLADDFDYGE